MLNQLKLRILVSFSLIVFFTISGMAQVAPVDFEDTGDGADWTWTVFENDYNPPLEFVDNPAPDDVNCSEKVAKFTALQTGNPWAGCETMHGEDIGTFTITEDNKILKIMVWKPVISDVGIKLVAADGFALPEIKIPNTVVNEWEIITYDFSAHIGNTYDQIVVFPDFDLDGRDADNICYFDHIWGDEMDECGSDGNWPVDYEADGHGADWTWTVFENDYNPPVEIVDNPDMGGINCSPTVAKFIALQTGNPWAGCETMHGEDIGTFTITEENKIMNIMVYKPVISDVGIKLVAADGFALPEIKIPNTLINEWEVITFDFSAHVGNTYDQIVIFPDFDLDGREADNICYWDNIWGEEMIECEPEANTPVDYEEGGHGADWTWTVFENDYNPPVEIVANPDPTDTNCSATVAKFIALQTGNPWAGCETMHGEDIGTFTITEENKLINIMVWKPVISDVGIKLVAADGFALPEIKIPNTVVNQWEVLTFDFSDHIGNTYDQIVIFPDFDLDGRDADNICYWDNIWGDSIVACPPEANVPADFEEDGHGADWTWTVFENDTNPPLEFVDNPDPTDTNCSPTVAKFTALQAGNPWAGCETMHGEDIGTFTITEENKLINIMVWKPVISDVGVKLVAADGFALPEIKIPNTLVNEWEVITFDFSDHIGNTYDQIVIFPDFDLDGRDADNICYFDNIWGDSTVICPPEANAPVDYEEGGHGADWTWTVFENDTNPPVEIVDNPDPSETNCSETVAKFTALQAGNPWAGCETMHGEDIGTFTITEENKLINIMVWKPVISDVGIKLVAEDGFALPEIKIPNTLVNEWEVITFDFSDHIGNTYDQIVIFPDFDLDGRDADNICYWDNIWGDSVVACPPVANVPIDHEEGGFGADWTWTVFENDTNPPLEIVVNPDSNDVNCSEMVAKFTALEAGNPWAGYESTHGEGIGTFTITEENKIINVMVWKPVISDVGVKLVAEDGFALPEIKVPNTLTNEWELLTFDFSDHIGNTYDQIVIFPDFDLDGRTGDNICYIDNIWGAEEYPCVLDSVDDSGVEELEQVNSSLYPNPAEGQITVAFEDHFVGQVIVSDLTGRSIIVKNVNSNTVEIDLDNLPSSGIYLAKIINENGTVVDVKKFARK